MDSDERLNYKLNIKHEKENREIIKRNFKIIKQHDETRELLAEEDIGMIQKGQYTFTLQALCKYGTSKWSEPVKSNRSDVRLLSFDKYRVFNFYK